MIRLRAHLLLRISVVAALALPAAGCGVKGALEPPPGTKAAIEAEKNALGPATYPPEDAERRAADIAAYEKNTGKPVRESPNAKRRSSFDWLLD